MYTIIIKRIMEAIRNLILPITTVTICIYQIHRIVFTRSLNFSRVIIVSPNFKYRGNAYYNRISKWVI